MSKHPLVPIVSRYQLSSVARVVWLSGWCFSFVWLMWWMLLEFCISNNKLRVMRVTAFLIFTFFFEHWNLCSTGTQHSNHKYTHSYTDLWQLRSFHWLDVFVYNMCCSIGISWWPCYILCGRKHQSLPIPPEQYVWHPVVRITDSVLRTHSRALHHGGNHSVWEMFSVHHWTATSTSSISSGFAKLLLSHR